MIKKQYHRYPNVNRSSYFNNFLRSCNLEAIIENELNKYDATIAKSKRPNSMFNIKWNDERKYILFVLRYS